MRRIIHKPMSEEMKRDLSRLTVGSVVVPKPAAEEKKKSSEASDRERKGDESDE